MTDSLFSTGHIALTSGISGVLAGVLAGLWLRGPRRALEGVAVAVLTFAAVFMLRKSANMPQLNSDGLSGFSANDLLAPVVTWVVLGCYAAFRPVLEPRRFEQARAATTALAFAINVITI